jgi:hypothetical protein
MKIGIDLGTANVLVYPPDITTRVAPSAHRALLAVPLTVQDRILGALVVADATGRAYDENDAQLAQKSQGPVRARRVLSDSWRGLRFQ